MEVHGRQQNNTRDQLQRTGRDRIRHAAELLEGVKDGKAEAPATQTPQEARDAIELSAAATAGQSSSEREGKVERLAQAMKEGRLLTPERLERAAAKMLGG